MHFRHRNVNNDTLAALLARAGVNVFTVWPDTDGRLELLQPDVGSWPTPSLALLKGTTLGARSFDFYLSSTNVTIQNGQIVPAALIEWRQLPMEQQFDAVLYLGPSSSMAQSKLSPDLCSDSRYIAMRMARIANLPVPPGAPSAVDETEEILCQRRSQVGVSDDHVAIDRLRRPQRHVAYNSRSFQIGTPRCPLLGTITRRGAR